MNWLLHLQPFNALSRGNYARDDATGSGRSKDSALKRRIFRIRVNRNRFSYGNGRFCLLSNVINQIVNDEKRREKANAETSSTRPRKVQRK